MYIQLEKHYNSHPDRVQTLKESIKKLKNGGSDEFKSELLNTFKDPYILDFLNLKNTYLEQDLERAILQELETFEFAETLAQAPARFPVQFVVRPMTEAYHDYRGYAGKISSGTFKVGDEIRVLPTGQTSIIATIEKFENSIRIVK